MYDVEGIFGNLIAKYKMKIHEKEASKHPISTNFISSNPTSSKE